MLRTCACFRQHHRKLGKFNCTSLSMTWPPHFQIGSYATVILSTYTWYLVKVLSVYKECMLTPASILPGDVHGWHVYKISTFALRKTAWGSGQSRLQQCKSARFQTGVPAICPPQMNHFILEYLKQQWPHEPSCGNQHTQDACVKYGKNNVTWQTCRPTHPFISVNTNITAGTETQIRMKAFSIGFTRASIITSTPKKVVNCPNFLLWKRVACLDIILLKPFLMVCQNGHHIQEYWILHENNYLGTIKTGNNLDCHIMLLRMLYVTKPANWDISCLDR